MHRKLTYVDLSRHCSGLYDTLELKIKILFHIFNRLRELCGNYRGWKVGGYALIHGKGLARIFETRQNTLTKKT